MRKGLTLTIVFEAESANYGEGIGNITALKKMSRSDGNMYTYISRQALRYNIVQQMGIDNTPVSLQGSGDKGVVQFSPEAEIDKYPEIDLFGYMKTKSKSDEDTGGAATRNAVARLSNAISLEPYNSDLDFLTNMGLAARGTLDGKKINNNIAQSEIHHSFYSYTISVDLDRIGEDKSINGGVISLPNSEKASRVINLLEALQFLYRDIKGRRENLSPVFIIGGVFDRKSPYYEGRCKIKKGAMDCSGLKAVRESCDDTKLNTLVGLLSGSFSNCSEIEKEMSTDTVEFLFKTIKGKVMDYYA